MSEVKKEGAAEEKVALMDYRIFGVPLWIFVLGVIVLAVSIAATMPLPKNAQPGAKALPSLPLNIPATILVLFVCGYIWGEIGNRIPIWKDYFGGGALLAFIGTSFLVSMNLIPQPVVKSTHEIFEKYGALDLWIAITITSSILSIDRKLLGRAIGGFIPMVIVGTLTALGGAVLGGMLCGISFQQTILDYAMPIMGGGNGAGALPMSQIWGQVTGKDPKIWYSSAISILTIANIMAILVGSILNGIGKKFPHLTGNGELLKVSVAQTAEAVVEKKPAEKSTLDDAVAGLFVVSMFYVLSNSIGRGLLPTVGGVVIHPYAYMVVLLILANAANIFPERIKGGVKMVNKFMMDKLFYLFLGGIGISFTSFDALVKAANLQTLVICALTVLGAVIGCWFFAKLVGFFEIESAIAAGLCHVNRGGSGDMEVLGASNRMNLMPYAQVATRLGGAMILVAASILFGIWLK